VKVYNELSQLYLQHGPYTLIHGACATGADAAAAHWYIVAGQSLGCIEVKYRAEWEQFGNRAGPMRNEKMIREAGADLVLAFPLFGSKGTWHTINLAEEAGITVKKVMS
jgi:hypothetical protein